MFRSLVLFTWLSLGAYAQQSELMAVGYPGIRMGFEIQGKIVTCDGEKHDERSYFIEFRRDHPRENALNFFEAEAVKIRFDWPATAREVGFKWQQGPQTIHAEIWLVSPKTSIQVDSFDIPITVDTKASIPVRPLQSSRCIRPFEIKKRYGQALVADWNWKLQIRVPSLGGHAEFPIVVDWD